MGDLDVILKTQFLILFYCLVYTDIDRMMCSDEQHKILLISDDYKHWFRWWLGASKHQGITCSAHWGRVTHICVGKLTIIGSDNGLSLGRPQTIIWTNAGILLIEPLGTIFSEILIGIQILSFAKMRLKMASVKWRPVCLGLNVLNMLKAPNHH